MKKALLIIFLAGAAALASAQEKTLDIAGIHQLVDQSISENKLQAKARNEQAVVTVNEKANLSLLDKLKGIYRTLQQRYNTLGTAIDIAQVGTSATPMVKRIIASQQQIMALAEKNPALVAVSFEAEIQFAQKAKSLSGYLAGLLLSAGDINQMKASDRKMLFDYVLSQLSVLQELSANMVTMMQYSSLAALLKAANPFQHFIDADKNLAAQVIQNAKFLK